MGLRVHTVSALHGLTRNPWNPDPHGRRIERRRGVGARFGHVAGRARQRHRRLAAQPGLLLRRRVAEARARTASPRHRALGPKRRSWPRSSWPSKGRWPAGWPTSGRRSRCWPAPDVRDPFCTPAPLTGPPLGAPVRVALVPEPSGGSTAPEIAAGVRAAGEALAAAGYVVDEVSPPMVEEAIDTWARWLVGELMVMKPLLSTVMSEEAMVFLGAGRDHVRCDHLRGLLRPHAAAP